MKRPECLEGPRGNTNHDDWEDVKKYVEFLESASASEYGVEKCMCGRIAKKCMACNITAPRTL